MSLEKEIKRYAAYFRGWCQAFGEHENTNQENDNINWLFGKDQLGLILNREIRKAFYKELLGKEQEILMLTVSSSWVKIGDLIYPLQHESDKNGFETLANILNNNEIVHMYLTYHLMYQTGTRIVTFATKPPLGILYKEMEPLRIKII